MIYQEFLGKSDTETNHEIKVLQIIEWKTLLNYADGNGFSEIQLKALKNLLLADRGEV